jgi:prepilin-type processing-associated H-X9-DG protein
MKHVHSSRRVCPCLGKSRAAAPEPLEPLEPRRLLAAAITGLTLMDADTNRPIESLDYGDTIDLARVGRHLTIRAGAVDAESVRFNYDGNPDHHIDNASPYAIAGDRRRGRDFLPWTPTPGTHTLVVTPYATDDAAGAPGPSRIVLFNVIDSRAAGRNYAPPARGSAVRRQPAPSLPTVPAPLSINAGGGAFTDSLGRVFRADTNFTGGSTANTTTDIANTTDDPLYQTYRTGENFSFSHPVANGHYSLWLHFADPTATQAGERTFDVTAEGALALDDYDVFANAGGANTATAESIDVHISDNRLDLNFSGVAGDAIVSAVTLIPTDVPSDMKPYVVGCDADEFPDAFETASRVRSASNLRQVGQGLLMYAGDHKGWLPPAVTDVARYGLPHYTFASPRTSTAMPRGELSPIEGSAWIRHLEDYVFFHLGERMLRLGREDVLGYENPDRVNGPITVLFADGHVEFVERAAAAALIGFPDAPPTNPPEPPEATGPQCVRDAGILGSATNLRNIANSLLAYANDQRGQYPADLGTLFSASQLELSTFVNPRGDTVAPSPDLSQEAQIEWINASNDYVYITRRSADPRELVLAYENPSEMKDGINIFFADGRVEFREMRWAIETLRRAGLPGVA